jgi:hypothetical protein
VIKEIKKISIRYDFDQYFRSGRQHGALNNIHFFMVTVAIVVAGFSDLEEFGVLGHFPLFD